MDTIQALVNVVTLVIAIPPFVLAAALAWRGEVIFD